MFVEILLWPYSCFSYVSYMINTFPYISMIVAECLFYVIAFFICIFPIKKKIRQISDRIDKSRSAWFRAALQIPDKKRFITSGYIS